MLDLHVSTSGGHCSEPSRMLQHVPGPGRLKRVFPGRAVENVKQSWSEKQTHNLIQSRNEFCLPGSTSGEPEPVRLQLLSPSNPPGGTAPLAYMSEHFHHSSSRWISVWSARLNTINTTQLLTSDSSHKHLWVDATDLPTTTAVEEGRGRSTASTTSSSDELVDELTYLWHYKLMTFCNKKKTPHCFLFTERSSSSPYPSFSSSFSSASSWPASNQGPAAHSHLIYMLEPLSHSERWPIR